MMKLTDMLRKQLEKEINQEYEGEIMKSISNSLDLEPRTLELFLIDQNRNDIFYKLVNGLFDRYRHKIVNPIKMNRMLK